MSSVKASPEAYRVVWHYCCVKLMHVCLDGRRGNARIRMQCCSLPCSYWLAYTRNNQNAVLRLQLARPPLRAWLCDVHAVMHCLLLVLATTSFCSSSAVFTHLGTQRLQAVDKCLLSQDHNTQVSRILQAQKTQEATIVKLGLCGAACFGQYAWKQNLLTRLK